MPAIQNRSYAAAHFGLELDGKDNVGLFRSIEGGGVRADVMTYQGGGSYLKMRQLGKPKFEDIKVQVGMAMSKPFYDWIADFFEGMATRKTGAIVAADFYYNERARRSFDGAMIRLGISMRRRKSMLVTSSMASIITEIQRAVGGPSARSGKLLTIVWLRSKRSGSEVRGLPAKGRTTWSRVNWIQPKPQSVAALAMNFSSQFGMA